MDRPMNILIALLTLAGLYMMMGGLDGDGLAFSSHGLKALKYYTVLSNLLAGLASLCLAFADTPFTRTLKLSAAVSVVITFLVTALFLAPTAKGGYLSLYRGSNFLFHLVIPVLCVLSLTLLERPEYTFTDTLTAVIPTALYAAYYIANVLTHLKDGAVDRHYDWYGFFFAGKLSILAVLPLILGIAWGAALLLRLAAGR